jgi:putative nucleotidyltransferase with HDIG domain
MQSADIRTALQPWIERIDPESLREQVANVWLLALERSGYHTLDEWRRLPFTLEVDCRGIGLIEHTLAVTAGSVGLARAQADHYARMPYPIDLNRLIAGGLLHDVGKVFELEPDGRGGYRKTRNGALVRHPFSGAALATEVGLPPEIVNCIACHAKEGEGRPQVIETVLLHQADFAAYTPLVMMQSGSLIV